MPLFNPRNIRKATEDDIDAMPASEPKPAYSWWDVVEESFLFNQREESYLWSQYVNADGFLDRNAENTRAINDGLIPEDVLDTMVLEDGEGVRLDHDRVAKWLNEHEGTTISRDVDIKANIRADLSKKREKMNEVYSSTGGFSRFTGQFVGGMGKEITDISMVFSMMTGLGAPAKAGSKLLQVAKAAAVTGVMEGSIETLRQPSIYAYKDAIGSEYSIGDAITTILGTGAAAGVLTGVLKGAKPAAEYTVKEGRALVSKMREMNKATPSVKDRTDVETSLAVFDHELNNIEALQEATKTTETPLLKAAQDIDAKAQRINARRLDDTDVAPVEQFEEPVPKVQYTEDVAAKAAADIAAAKAKKAGKAMPEAPEIEKKAEFPDVPEELLAKEVVYADHTAMGELKAGEVKLELQRLNNQKELILMGIKGC